MDLPEPINPSKLATQMDDHLGSFFGRAIPLKLSLTQDDVE